MIAVGEYSIGGLARMGLNHIPAASGIYAIVNKTNGHRYVGQATNMRDRVAQQYRALQTGSHLIRGRRTLQDAWDAFGPDAFDFVVLEFVDDNHKEINVLTRPDNLSLAEQFYVDQKSEYNSDKSIVSSAHRDLVETYAWRARGAPRLDRIKQEILALTNIERRALRKWLDEQTRARELTS